VHDKDVPKASAEEQNAWKARSDLIDEELKHIRAAMKDAPNTEKSALEKKLAETEERKPEPLPALFSVTDDPAKRSQIHLLARGDYQNKGDRVGMRPPGILLPDGAAEAAADAPTPRAELAKWLTDPGNPLTARVMVNRIWHYHFGRGIVATPNDFGRMGQRPSHPELLDWLANEFVTSGFSVKHIHRLILASNTYRQSSDAGDAQGIEKDPDNRLLWHFSRRRLDAEEIRDAMLAASGKLNLAAGGPSVIVPIEKELVDALYKPSQWAVSPDPAEHNRRSVYLIAKRNLRLPSMEVFDAPDLLVSCPRRESSTHAPQALELLNGTMVHQQAAALVERLAREAHSPQQQIDLAYRLVTGRAPSAAELRVATTFLDQGTKLRQFALAMFNLNAFLYVD
jgi:hypothetical protein